MQLTPFLRHIIIIAASQRTPHVDCYV